MTRLQCTDKKILKLLLTLFHATSPFVSASIPFISATILHSSSLLLNSSPPTIPSSTRFYSIRLHYCSVISVPLFRRLLPTILLSPPLYIFHRILPIVPAFLPLLQFSPPLFRRLVISTIWPAVPPATYV